MTAQKSLTEKDNQDEQYHTNHIYFFGRQTTLEEPNCLQISERLFFFFFCRRSVFFQSPLSEWFRTSELKILRAMVSVNTVGKFPVVIDA